MTLSESLPVTEAHAVDRAVDRTVDLAALPADFAWGTATSAYQIEGAVDEDGRAPSIWDTFSRVPGAVDGGHTGDTACDHYHRWPDDIALMRQLGTNAYRLSVAWPRILPGGDGPVNTKGLDFYDRLTDGLLAAGIEPNVTLYHWDLPQALQDRGGWPERATAEHFAAYAGLVAERLGDRVTQWATLNEPLCSAWIGHLEGRMAPGWTDLTAAVRASYHLLLGHGLAAQAVRAARPAARIGIVNNLSTVEPATGSEADRAAARRMDGHVNRWWLDPVHGRGFPADMREVYGVDLPERPGDLATIAAPSTGSASTTTSRRWSPPTRPAPRPSPARSTGPASRAPAWTGRSTPTAWKRSSCACTRSTGTGASTSPRTAPRTPTPSPPTAASTTPNGPPT